MMLPKTTWLQPLIQLNHVYICYKNVPLHKSFGFMLLIGIHLGRSCMFSFLKVKWIDLWNLWSCTATYTMEFMEVNTIKIRLYSLEVVGWILKDIKLICEQFVSIYLFYYFIIFCFFQDVIVLFYLLLVLQLAKENEEAFVLNHFSLFPLYTMILNE